ncbi:MAG: DKNYY domain-containing protein, partial [Candidatus Pacebacteria bacterium]|nr:DKNYY domain-containing protein [Candidatus Paceibacterota bacterium]
MDENQDQRIDVEQTEDQDIPLNATETELSKKNIIPTRLGLLIILLAATIAGAGVWWYAGSYTPPEVVDVVEMQERRETEKEVFSNYEIKADGVYFHGKVIEEADAETFVVLMDLFYIDNPSGYSKDKSKVFFKENEILGVDVESFVLIQQYDGKVIETGMAQDINNRYYFGRRIVERDIVDELENLGDSYYKDEFNVYREMRYSSGSHSIFIPVILSQFDVESFEFIGLCWYMEGSGSYHESYIKDKNNVFCGE